MVVVVMSDGAGVELGVIYRRNTITADEARRLSMAAMHPKVEIPPRVRAAAEKAGGRMGPEVEKWLENSGCRPWLVINAADGLHGEAIAAQVLMDPRLGARGTAALRRVGDLLSKIDEAPRYGPACKSAVIRAWAKVDALGLTGFGRAMPTRALDPVVELLELRLDRLATTVIVETSPGREWAGALVRAGVPKGDVDRLTKVIAEGLGL